MKYVIVIEDTDKGTLRARFEQSPKEDGRELATKAMAKMKQVFDEHFSSVQMEKRRTFFSLADIPEVRS